MKATPEIEVLIATAIWLWHQKALPYRFSLVQGRDINIDADRKRFIEELSGAGIPEGLYSFVSDGPDIETISETEWWQIECKGAGLGKRPTQRNNFDRALASVVSYYADALPETPEELEVWRKRAHPRLGLALPATADYLHELKRRVRQPLRRALKLWILLYDPKQRTIRAVSPDDEF